MIMEIQVLPTPMGTADEPYAYVDAAIAAIAGSGLAYEVGALGTVVEGEADDIWDLARAAHDATLASGAESVMTNVKLAERPGGGLGMRDLVAPYREH